MASLQVRAIKLGARLVDEASLEIACWLVGTVVELADIGLKLLHWAALGLEGRIIIGSPHLHALAHLCILVASILALGTHLRSSHGLACDVSMFKSICFVDVERQVFLKLLDLIFTDLAGLEVLLSLSLECPV